MTLCRLNPSINSDWLANLIKGTSNLLGYWPLDDVSIATVRDASGLGRTGSYGSDAQVGAPGLGNVAGKAARFADPQSGNTFATVTYDASFVVTGAMSVEWCERRWSLDFGGVVAWDAHGFFGPQAINSTTGTGGKAMALKKRSASVLCTSTVGVEDTYLWHHWVLTWDGTTTAHVYLDGVDVSGATTAQTFASGGVSDMVWGTGFYQANMSHGAYYAKELSAGEVGNRWTYISALNNWPRATVQFGMHQALNSQTDSGIRANQITRATGVGSAASRFDARWDQIEASAVSGYDWTVLDNAVNAIDTAGMIPYATISSSPTWANGGATVINVPGVGVDATFNSWVTAYATFVTALVNRYKAKVHYWELWNEPNVNTFWSSADTGLPDGVRYGTWYKAIRTAILAADATAKVVFSGGVAVWYNAGSTNTQGEAFMSTAIGVGGVTIDYAACHPYTSSSHSPDAHSLNNFDHVLATHDKLVALGYPNVKLILSEMGWQISDHTLQAAYMQTSFSRIKNYWSAFVPLVFWYRDWDAPGNTNYGIWRTMPSDGSAPTATPAATIFDTFT